MDATYAVGRELSGVGKYSLHLMAALEAAGVNVRRYYRPHRWWRAPWGNWRHPKGLLLERAPDVEVFHGLNQRMPRRGRAAMVCTFHDLFVLSAEYSTPEFRKRFAGQAREAAERSDWIIAVSQFTARQVADYLGFPQKRIAVVPHGVFLPNEIVPAEARRKVVLTVGAVQKRKNTKRLIEAFAMMPQDWELWIAGSAGYGAEQMLAGAGANVRVLGYVSDADLGQLYREAAIFAFPSLDEGFGIPVLEAMAHGLPVISSTASALPEVCGDAAVLVDPLDVDALGAALRAWTDVEPRRAWIDRGRQHAKAFSWDRAAKLTADVYRMMRGS